MTPQATTTPDTVVVPVDAIQRLILAADGYGVRYLDSDDMSDEAQELQDATEMMKDMLAARPAATPGGEREDSAFKIASDLHAAYEQLIYGLPKYLEAENLTDEENMIREAYITLDVTAHRLAALSRPAPVTGEAKVYHAISLETRGPVEDARRMREFEDRFLATPTAARGGEGMDWQSVAMWMGFAASVIKSGEAWSDQCQQHYDEAKAAFARLNTPALSAKGGS